MGLSPWGEVSCPTHLHSLVGLCVIVCLLSLHLVRLHIGAGRGKQATEPHGLVSNLQTEYLYTSVLAIRDDFGPGGCSLTPWDTHPPSLIQLPPISAWYPCSRLGSLVSWPMTGGITHLGAGVGPTKGPLCLLSGVGLGLGLIPQPPSVAYTGLVL